MNSNQTVRAAAWAAVSAGILAGHSSAQTVVSGTPFSAAPIVLSEAGGTSTALQLKCEGYRTSPPTGWTRPTGPYFDLERIFQRCNVHNAMPDVDAFSIGLDWILADDSTGRVNVPPNRWAGLTLSVTSGSVGEPGSVVNSQTGTGEDPGADIFSWLLPGSALPAPLVATTERALDSLEIGFNTATELDALDHYVPIFAMDPQLTGSNLVPANPTIFFSVSNATLGNVPINWWDSTAPSGATILFVRWNGQRWSCPRPWRIYSDLGLDVNEDIDALAIDQRACRLLMSTKSTTRNEILFLSYKTDMSTPVTYTDPTGTPVTEDIGLINSDEVDAICALDPSVPPFDQGGIASNVLGVTYASPRGPLLFPGIPREIEASGYLACWSGTGPGQARFFAATLPPGGDTSGFLGAFVSFPGIPGPPIPVGPFPIATGGTFEGSPVDFAVNLPPAARLMFPSVDVEVVWLSTNSTFTAFGQSYAMRLSL